MAKQYHPSDQLYNNQVRDFLEAMQLYKQQFNKEMHLCFGQYAATQTEEGVEFQRLVDQAHKDADIAADIYRRHVVEARENAAREMRECGISEAVADAVVTEDYSSLAI